MRRRQLACGIGALLLAGSAAAQTPPVRVLGPPLATFDEPFSRVAGVREQSDGRVVLLDPFELRIVRIDVRTGALTPLGRSGAGPGEYTLPISLVSLRGDTTLAVDMGGGGRALVITASGVSEQSLRATGAAERRPMFTSTAVQSDGAGNLYELTQRFPNPGSAAPLELRWGVRRLNRTTGTQDTIGELSRVMRSPLIGAPRRASSSAPTESRRRVGTPPPYSSVDQWAVAPDGRIAFVTVDPFRVTFVLPSGARVEGAVLREEPVKLTEQHKVLWRQERQQPVLSLSYAAGGGITAGRTAPRFVEPEDWPEVLPPFLDEALRFAPDGTLWIERTTLAGGPKRYSLVDARGRITRTVVLPPRTRLVGFGAGTLYLVRIDEDEFEYLERYAVPQ